jgi:beta-glucosidase
MVIIMRASQFFSAVTAPKPKPKVRSAFDVGFANCGFQAWGRKGGGESDWTVAADNKTVPEPGFSYNHYDNIEADLDIMAAGGANSYRISIDWADIQDEHGQLIDKGVQFYKKLFAACKARNLKVMATLLHFTQPKWFVDKGGFEKEENIHYFVSFSKKMVELFGDDVALWCTINEPAIQAFSGYLLGEFPPHRHNLQMTVAVLLNLLKAHVAVYKEIKRMPQVTEVGIVHNVLRFKPRYSWEPLEAYAASFLTEIFDDLVMRFLKTGKFDYERTWLDPLRCYNLHGSCHYEDPGAVGAMDFIGLNFYANAVIGFNVTNIFGPTHFAHQKMGDLALTVDPEGLEAALYQCSDAFRKPVYITELGVADTSDLLRQDLLNRCLGMIDKMCGKIDLRGLYFWTFKANYEWPHGYTKQFGMYRLDGSKMESAIMYEDYMHQTGWVQEQVPQGTLARVRCY